MIKKDHHICILGGGWSNEREISLKSSNDVYKSLKSKGHNVHLYDMSEDSYDDLKNFLNFNSIDMVFNLIHGEGGEDGKIQGYLDEIGIHYCGSDSKSSALSFNKYQTKKIWQQNDISTPKFILYEDQQYEELAELFKTTFFIKDTCSGSSNNIFKIDSMDDYKYFLDEKNERQYMVEQGIFADEYTAAIINDKVLPIIKIIPSNSFYDYDAKYKSDKTQFIFPDLDINLSKEISLKVSKAFNVLGCSTWARVDFFIDESEIILLEINTIPGMTDHSLVPKAADKYGLTYYDLIMEIMGIHA